MTPPEWLAADERALAQLRERGVCDTYEKEYMRQDGTRVPVSITDAMMPGDSGDILAFVFDITERKQAEEQRQRLAQELADRAAELQAVLNAAPVAVWIAHDPQSKRITGNAYADKILQAPQGGNVSRSACPTKRLSPTRSTAMAWSCRPRRCQPRSQLQRANLSWVMNWS